MHTLGACLIEEQLFKIRAASPSLQSFYAFVNVLHKTLQNLTKLPSDDASLTIKKDAKFFKDSLSLPEIQELLKLLGYQEEEDRYIFKISDENCMKSEGCLYLLEEVQKKNSSAGLPVVSEHQGREDSPFGGRQSRSLNDLEERNRFANKENCEGAIKASVFMRHLKKEENSNSNTLLSHLRHDVDQKRRSSSFTFDGNGFFHQSRARKDSRPRRNLTEKFFQHQHHHNRYNHVQDLDSKKWGRTGLDLN